tara:strand:- start:904 stop:1245 length:342 start_codon:yes stop_codon:yes gene_type:complete
MNPEIENKIKSLIQKKPNLVYKIDDKVQRYEDIVNTMFKYKIKNKLPVKYEQTPIKDVFDFHLTNPINSVIMFDSINLEQSFIMSKIDKKEYYIKIPKIPNHTLSSIIAVYTN